MYTIKRAAELTGVPAATLRAWERRYGLVAPERTDAGYRLYDEESLGRIREMAALVADGLTPSNAARELDRAHPPTPATTTTAGETLPSPTAPTPAPTPDDEFTDRLVDAAAAMDAKGVGRLLDERFALGSFESVVDEWLMPALDQLGRAWADGRVTVAGEHLVAHAVLRRLAAAYEAAASRPDGPPVVVGLPPGVQHELGIFAFAVALRRLGVDVIYLGPDLPATDWRAALDSHAARHAVLAVPRRRDARAAREVVKALLALDDEVTVFVGGSHQEDVDDPAATHLGHAIGPAAAQVAAILTR